MRLFLKIIGGLLLIIVLVIGGLALSLRANQPDSTFDVQANAAGDGSSILIFGATRNTGLMVAELLEARGDNVTAFVRATSSRAELEKLDVEYAVGDALDLDSIRAAMAGGSYDAVLTTIGCFSCDPSPDYLGNANIFRAASEAGIRRVILVTTIGPGESFDALPGLSANFLKDMIPLKEQAEDALRASGLDFTIVRPGGLRSGTRTGNGILSEDPAAFGYIFREDLAELLVGVLDDDRSIGKTLAAIDSGRSFPWSNE
ncbi:MAG: NAD(P)-dependent oxidoreductase [Gammaproteobacteria bacterium]